MAQLSQDNLPTLRDYMRVVWIRKWVVAAFVAVFVVLALGYSLTQPKLYEATTRLMYSPPANATDASSSSSVDVNNLTIQLQSVENTINSSGVRSLAASQLSKDAAAAGYTVSATVVTPSSTTTSAIPDSVDVTAQAWSPKAAADIANAYADAVIAIRRSDQQARLQAAQRVLEQQLEAFQSAASKLSADYVTLSLRLRDLQVAEGTATGDFVVLAQAAPPSSPASPKPMKSAVLGLSAGLFLGVVAAFIIGQFDVKVRTYREVASALDLNIVGRIPRLPHRSTPDDELIALSEPEGTFSEALRVLRSNLDWVNIDGQLRVLLVSSCLKGEGKTLAVCNLAVTLARAGKSVVVVDADLRSPRVHRLFGLDNSAGLTSVARGTTTLDKALQLFDQPPDVRVRTATRQSPTLGGRSQWEGALRILTSGPLPPNPGEVVASRSVADVITAVARLEVDYVLVDVPPLLGFGDAGALASMVDALLMVANMKRARKPILEEGREILRSLPCPKVGVVVTGEKIEESHYASYVS